MGRPLNSFLFAPAHPVGSGAQSQSRNEESLSKSEATHTPDLEDPSALLLPPWPLALAGLVVICPMYAAISLALGQDGHFDTFLYHRYVPWAWINGRMDFDFAPSQVQTYFNPLVELPVYFLREKLSPKESGAVLGAIHGLSAWLLMLISWAVLHRLPLWHRLLGTVAATAFGVLGVEAMDGIGRANNDSLLSLFPLTALLLLVSRSSSPTLGIWALAGFLLGFGTGLKMTLVAHAIAFGVLAALAPASWRRRVINVAVAGFSGVLGVATSGGWWMLEMYQRFGNPVFPQWNHLFKSPYYSTKEIETPGLGLNLIDHLLFSYRFTMDPWSIRSLGSDFRFVACTLAFLVFLGFWIFHRFGPRRRPVPWTILAPVVFFAVSFFAWQGFFGACLRYVVSLDFLAGLILMLITLYTVGNLHRFGAVVYLVLACVIFFQEVDDTRPRRWDWEPKRF